MDKIKSIFKSDKKTTILMYTLLILYGVITLYPFLYSLTASFKTHAEIVTSNSLLPNNPTLDNYKYLFGRSPLFTRWVINSFAIATLVAVLNIIFNSMAGYALAKLEFPGKKKFFFAVLAILMIPAQVLLIPKFIIMKNFGLIDTYAAVVIPGAINASYIIMMRQFFLTFPKDLEEAAEVDGLSKFGTFTNIVIPLVIPIVGTMFLFTFLGSWNNFMDANLYLKSPEMWTLPVGINSFNSQYAGVNYGWTMASSIVSIIPIMILYILLNGYFLDGIELGGEK